MSDGERGSWDGTARVLVVDDNPKMAETVAGVLSSRLAVEPTVETNPTNVRDHLGTTSFDCVVSDYEMPGLDGLELLSVVREDHPDLPFVLLTGAGSESVASDALSKGASEYVRKGTAHAFDELTNRIRRLIDRYRTERRLREVQERKHQWMEAATDGFLEYDAESDTFIVREGFEDTFGIPKGQQESGLEWITDHVHPADRDRVFGEIDEAIRAQREVVEQEFRFRDGEGEFRHVRDRLRLVYDEDWYVGALGAVWDISTEVTQEERLREYETLLNNTEDVAMLVGPGGTVQQVNDGVCTLTGKPRDELLGSPVSAVLDTELADPSQLERTIRSILDGTQDEGELEARLEDHDRRRTIGEVRLDAVESTDGERGVALTARDVTARVDRELALERFATATQELVRASSRAEIAAIAMETVEDAFDCTLSAVWYAERDALRMADCTRGLDELLDCGGDTSFVHGQDSAVWDVYETGEVTVLEDVDSDVLAAAVPVTTVIIAPLNNRGMLTLAGRDDQPCTGDQLDLIRILARAVTTALDGLEWQTELQRNRDLLATSQRLASVGAWEYDVQTDTPRWTDQVRRIHGTSPEYSVTTETAFSFYHPDDRPRVREALDRACEHGVGFDQRVRIVRDDGEVRWVRNVGQPQREDGDVVRISGAIQDITASYEQRQQLQENEESLRTLHDITTSPEQSPDQQIDSLLELGRDRLDISIGFLTDVHEETVDVTRVTGEAPSIETGTTLPLEKTYCRRVAQDEDVESIFDIRTSELAESGVRRQTGMSSYLGAPIFVEQEMRGTVCFGDPEPREHPFTDLDRAFVRIIAQQISHLMTRQRRRQRLKTLHRATQSLWETGSPDEIPGQMIDAVEELPDSPPLEFYRWDEATGALERVAVSDRATATAWDLPKQVADASHPLWKSFVQSETRLSDTEAGESDDWGDLDCTGISVPVAELGVVVACRSGGFQAISFEVEFLETLAQHMAAALEVVEQTRTLARYTDRLERQNEALERLEKLNSIIRDTHRTLVEATTRAEIEQAVCDRLAEIDHWDGVWIGTPSLRGEGFDVRAASEERVEAVARFDAEVAGEPLAAETVESAGLTEIDRILSADGPEPWRQTALEFGYQSVLSLPVRHEDRDYGVLEIYATRPDAFTDDQRAVLAELATTIAYAIASADRRQTFQTGSGVELDLRLPATEEFLLNLEDIVTADITITGTVPRTSGGYLAYASVEQPAQTDAELRAVPVVDSVNTFGAEGDEHVEIGIQDSQLLRTLSTFDARLQRLTSNGGNPTLEVVLPSTTRVRGLVERLQESYADTRVTAQRTRRPDDETHASILDSLTERQREVLTIAYHRGLFEWPRPSSGEEIAEALGIASATFYQHVRAAQQRVVERLLER